MAAISRIKPGQTLYAVERRKMGNTTISKEVVIPVSVIAVDPAGEYIMAARYGNPPRKMTARMVGKLRVSKPGTKKGPAGTDGKEPA